MRVERDAALQSFNTLRVPATTRELVMVENERDLAGAFHRVRSGGLPWFVLGGGSNLVLPLRYEGLVIAMRMRGVRIGIADAAGVTLVEAAAGESWHGLVRRCLGAGLAGIENLALIPGTVGAAPMQNIGAYGAELRDVFETARVYLPFDERFVHMTLAECAFGYRDSVFRHALRDRAVITGVTLRLRRDAATRTHYPDVQQELARLGRGAPGAVDIAEAVIRVRRRKLPDVRRYGNVGSFFKNPVIDAVDAAALVARFPALRSSTRFDSRGSAKVAAAALIELAGWKGRVIGRVEVWRRQPLVLVNGGGATGAEVLAVAAAIADDVAAQFGVTLAVEPRIDFGAAATG